MVKWYRKLICKLFGCRPIRMFTWRTYQDDERTIVRSEISGWKCPRCKEISEEQWDNARS